MGVGKQTLALTIKLGNYNMTEIELMIGDLVMLDFYDSMCWLPEEAEWKVGRITAIHHGHLVDIDFNGKIEHDVEVGDVRPVPLTPEILERNGWKCYGGNRWVHDVCSFELEQYDDVFAIDVPAEEYGSGNFCTIQYTHQLQHALRLGEIDKEVIL